MTKTQDIEIRVSPAEENETRFTLARKKNLNSVTLYNVDAETFKKLSRNYEATENPSKTHAWITIHAEVTFFRD